MAATSTPALGSKKYSKYLIAANVIQCQNTKVTDRKNGIV
jgi:hypothetical protein